MPTQKLRVFFYVQHLLGIGHLMRARRIAIALRQNDVDVTLITGGLPVAGFDTAGLNHIALPAMAVRDGNFAVLVDSDDNPVDDEFRAQRCRVLLEAYHKVKPDVVILEAYPFGRRQVRFELTPLIAAIESTSPRPILLASLRDILQRRSKPGRAEESVNLVKRHFDKVLVHGDPAFVGLEQSFPLAVEISDQIIYTGIVCGASTHTCSQAVDIVVSAGGGAVGAKLLNASVQAAMLLPDSGKWCIIAGPNMADDDFTRIAQSAPPNVDVKRFVLDLESLLSTSRLSISQAGYNTISDVARAGCRAILVPYSLHGETEQSDRAKRLEAMGLVDVVAEESLSGAGLAKAVVNAMTRNPPDMMGAINTDGANVTATIVRQLADA